MRCQGEFPLPFQAVQREINRSMGIHPERFGLGNAERCQLQPVKVTVHSGTDLERRRREALAELFGKSGNEFEQVVFADLGHQPSTHRTILSGCGGTPVGQCLKVQIRIFCLQLE